jgi:hypothetical protein
LDVHVCIYYIRLYIHSIYTTHHHYIMRNGRSRSAVTKTCI